MYEYRATGTCTKVIQFELDGTKVRDLHMMGGCPGNVKGIAKLVEGMEMDEVIARLEGVTCGRKSTSCPDQLAQALKAVKEQL